MIIPKELPDNADLRAAIKRHAESGSPADLRALELLLFDPGTLLLLPMCYMTVDSEEQPAFADIVDTQGMKAMHMYTHLDELRSLADNAVIVPYSLRKLMDQMLWADGYHAVVVDMHSPYSIYVQLLPRRSYRVFSTQALLSRPSGN